jgi:predicted DNA-binding protein
MTKQAPLRLTDELNARLETACRVSGEKRPSFIRRALVLELDRIEALRPSLSPAQASLLKKCEALAELQVDVDQVLERALRDAGEPLLRTTVAA